MLQMLRNSTLNVLILTSICNYASANDFMNSGVVKGVNPQNNEPASVQIFNRTNVAREANVVRYFFAYNCPYSEKYDEEMAIWGTTLPKGFHYVRVPVITNEPNTMIGAFAYYSAWVSDKSKINGFQKAAYDLIKNQQKDPSDQFTYLEAAKIAGYNTKKFKDAWSDPKTIRLVKNSVLLSAKYKISFTPTLSVGGLYTLNPEPIADSQTSFIDFANGITSKYISENKAAIQ